MPLAGKTPHQIPTIFSFVFGLICRGGNVRDKATINRLKMYRSGKPVRNKAGKVSKHRSVLDQTVGLSSRSECIS